MSSPASLPKRISYIQRRDDLDEKSFRTHWSQTHSRIARELPDVRAYVQNHVAHSLAIGGGDPPRIDGVVELWFENDTAHHAGFSSEVATRLAADELEFMQGLGGSAVLGGSLDGVDAPVALWMLGAWNRGTRPDAVCELSVLTGVDPTQITVNTATPGAKVLRRPRMLAMPVANVAVFIGLTSVSEAVALANFIASGPAPYPLSATQLLVAERLRIV